MEQAALAGGKSQLCTKRPPHQPAQQPLRELLGKDAAVIEKALQVFRIQLFAKNSCALFTVNILGNTVHIAPIQ